MADLSRKQIVSDVQGLLGDDAFDPVMITQGANWFINYLFLNNRLRMAETSDELDGSQGDTEVDFPDDMMTRISIYMTSPQVIDMKHYEMQYVTFMENYANFATVAPRQAAEWTEFGKQMRFSAPLSADTTFGIDYLREPVPMAIDTDTCELSTLYEELVAKGALIGMMMFNEDYDEADEELNSLAPKITAFIRQESRGGGKTGPAAVMRTNRGRVGGYRADRDFPG